MHSYMSVVYILTCKNELNALHVDHPNIPVAIQKLTVPILGHVLILIAKSIIDL